MPSQRVLIIGEVFIDTHLDLYGEHGPLVRLGGIFHAARAFAALNIDFVLGYYAPDYMDEDINYWSCYLETKGCFKLGQITKAPNVMLIGESKETGDQSYYNILKDQAEFIDLMTVAEVIKLTEPTDILVFPGRYSCEELADSLSKYSGMVHIDFHYDSDQLAKTLKTTIVNAFFSTASPMFKEDFGGTLDGAIKGVQTLDLERLIVKENRGGSYCFVRDTQHKVEAPAYYVPTMHSVGVGDVYNAVFISEVLGSDIEKNLRFAAFCAAKYAETMSYEGFKQNIDVMLDNPEEFIGLAGIRLSWEDRAHKNIYVAAPDFPEIDTRLLDQLYDALHYHNFRAHLPIRENGLVESSMTAGQELSIYNKDMELLDSCDLLIAVLLFNDPGTLVELGMFRQSGKPTIVYDPYFQCENIFVKHSADSVCRNLDEVINATYLLLGQV